MSRTLVVILAVLSSILQLCDCNPLSSCFGCGGPTDQVQEIIRRYAAVENARKSLFVSEDK